MSKIRMFRASAEILEPGTEKVIQSRELGIFYDFKTVRQLLQEGEALSIETPKNIFAELQEHKYLIEHGIHTYRIHSRRYIGHFFNINDAIPLLRPKEVLSWIGYDENEWEEYDQRDQQSETDTDQLEKEGSSPEILE